MTVAATDGDGSSASTLLDGHIYPALAPEGRSAGGTGEGPGRVKRLLVVEDDWFIGMEIEAVLRQAGYEVLDVVASAEAAVSAALEHKPDLVLMDIRLAGPRDGIDAAVDIREQADIPCLFVSAHGDSAARERAARSRPVGWITKPFSHAQLLSAIGAIERD